MIEIEEITTSEQLDGLREEWNRLIEQVETATIFQTWEWTSTWWNCFGEGELWILVGRERGALVGIAPLSISYFPYKVFRCAQLIGENGGGTSIYLDVLTVPHARQRCRDAFLEHLLANESRWDLAELVHVPEGSDSLEVAVPRQFRLTKEVEDTCLHTPLPEAWSTYLASLDAKFRQNINRHQRQLARELGVEIEVVDGDEVPAAMDDLIDLHELRWGAGSLFQSAAEDRRFHRHAANMLAKRGWLRLFRIRYGGRTIAAAYGFVFRAKGYAYLQGFDPEFARFGLGVLLRAHSIEDAIAGGANEFDWLRGQSSYKSRWKVAQRRCFRLVISKRGARSRLAGVLSRVGFRVFQEMLRLGWADRRQTGAQLSWTNSFTLMFGYALFRVSARSLLGLPTPVRPSEVPYSSKRK